MAERRMFAKTIIDSDAFVDMPLSTQALYFHLSMRGDDDGFINNPKKIQRMIGAADDDLKMLIVKRFIIPFDSGIVVIKHWKIHNYIRGDRKKETVYPEEMALLEEKSNGAYTLKGDMTDICPSIDGQVAGKCQHRLGKDSIGKVKSGKDSTNDAENPLDVLPEGVRSAFDDFAKMRKTKLKKPMTDNAVKRMLNKLNSLSTDEATQIAILNQSEDNCWLDIYPLKTDKPKQQNGGNPFLDMLEEGVFDE